MKSLLQKVILLAFTAGTFFYSTQTQAQNFGDLLSAGANDAETYLENYIAPGIFSLGNGLAGGWVNTAKTHKTLGFDFTITYNMAKIPDSEKMFSFNQEDYQNLLLRNDSDGILPTLVGGASEEGSQLVIPAQSEFPYGGQTILLQDSIVFDVPDGIDLKEFFPVPVSGFPVATANLGIGIYKNTDLKIRWVPQYTVEGYSVKEFGIGVMHDVKQWIPVIKNLPFDLSAFIGTTTLSMEYDLNVNIQEGTTTFEGSGPATFKTTATTFQGIISKKLLFFTPYASIGFNAVRSTLNVNGEYTYSDPINGSTSITDPISLQFENSGSPRITVGGQLKFLVFTLHGSYTVQNYNNLELGLGIAVR